MILAGMPARQGILPQGFEIWKRTMNHEDPKGLEETTPSNFIFAVLAVFVAPLCSRPQTSVYFFGDLGYPHALTRKVRKSLAEGFNVICLISASTLL
jgi:hypothetical protein